VVMSSLGIKRKVMFLLEKVRVLGKLDGGMRIAAVGCHDGVNGDKLSRSVRAIGASSLNIYLYIVMNPSQRCRMMMYWSMTDHIYTMVVRNFGTSR
jgi:hypothetical protein